ncbi:MAG: hypothetical protein KTR31_28685 [Myxococcales bacterium]|nr:hypothetical protein [Myxococcales bacterium]
MARWLVGWMVWGACSGEPTASETDAATDADTDADSDADADADADADSDADTDVVPWTPHARFEPTPLTWEVTGADVGDNGVYTTAAGRYDDGFWTTMDLDGDGLPDLVFTSPADDSLARPFDPDGSPYWKVYANTGAGFSSTPLEWSVPSADVGDNGVYTTAAGRYDDGFWTTMDLDGDDLPDLVFTSPADPSLARPFDPDGSPFWKVYANTGAGFASTPVQWSVPGADVGDNGVYTTAAGRYDDGFWTTMDLDGDDLPDLVFTSPADPSLARPFDPDGSPFWKVYANTGTGFASTPVQWSVPGADVGDNGVYTTAAGRYDDGFWTTMDLTGDGLADLVFTSPADDSLAQPFDPDGSPYWKVYESTGAGFASTPLQWPVPSVDVGDNGVYTTAAGRYDDGFWTTMDLDGGGLPDLVFTSPADPSLARPFDPDGAPFWKVYTNTGTGFSGTPVQWSVPSADLGDNGLYTTAAGRYDDGFWTTMDLDGDGGPDLVFTSPADPSLAQPFDPKGAPFWKVYLGTK